MQYWLHHVSSELKDVSSPPALADLPFPLEQAPSIPALVSLSGLGRVPRSHSPRQGLAAVLQAVGIDAAGECTFISQGYARVTRLCVCVRETNKLHISKVSLLAYF